MRAFLETIVDAPKRLWHPALVILDEAHVFAPENGKAESAGAVIDLATRGRKRGFCLVPATQRLSKLHKDVAAECNNKLIGRTGLDIDVKRAADELGFGRDRWRELRDLGPGMFFAYGPALARGVTAVEVGPIATTHPKAGARLTYAAPPPTAKVRALLPKLADLPAEAEQRQRTEADLRRDVQRLERELAAAKRAQPAPAEKPVEVPVLTDADRALLERVLAGITSSVDTVSERMTDALARALVPYRNEVGTLGGKLRPIMERAARAVPPVRPAPPAPRTHVQASGFPKAARSASAAPADTALGKCERQVLRVLATYGECDAGRLALLAGYTYSGGFRNSLSALRSAGYLAGENTATMAITDAGVAALGDVEPLPTGRALVDHWMRHSAFGKGERAILEALVEHPDGLTADQLCAATGYEYSGGFRNMLSALRTAGVLVGKNTETMRAHPDLLGTPRAA